MPIRRDRRLQYMSYFCVIIIFYFLFYNGMHFHYKHTAFNVSTHIRESFEFHAKKKLAAKEDMKYILEWTPEGIPLHLLLMKQDSFYLNKCKYTNCYITRNRNYLKNQKDYDAILFSGCSMMRLRYRSDLPQNRSWTQKYIFATLESSTMCPVTNPLYDDFFNWTWSMRLSSDISWNYLAVYDMNGNKIGPAKDIYWPKSMDPIDDYLKKKLKRKTKAAAWLVSHCKTPSRREDFVKLFKEEIKKYGWTLDEYGMCGTLQSCTSIWCYKMLKRDYFFYLSFENSFDEDYVSEKLLTPLKNYVVPVVYGGADYSRYLPPGSYLNARELGPKMLAKVMDNAIRNLSVYYDFFKWRNHFKYKSSEAGVDVCNLCTALNTKGSEIRTYKNFRIWWNGPVRQKTYDVMLKNFVINKDLRALAQRYNFTQSASLVLLKNITNQSQEQESLLRDLVYNKSMLVMNVNASRSYIDEIKLLTDGSYNSTDEHNSL